MDARLQSNSEDQLVASFRSLQLQDADLPVRPGFGTIGTPIKLRTNFFPVKVPKGPLYEYDVTIAPAVSVRRVKRRIFQLAEQTNDWAQAGMTGRVAHDHASKLIAVDKLPQPLVIRVPFTDEEDAEPRQQPAKPKGGKKGGEKKATPKEYTLTIKYVQDLETQSLVKYVPSVTVYRLPREHVKRLRFESHETPLVQVPETSDAYLLSRILCSALRSNCSPSDKKRVPH